MREPGSNCEHRVVGAKQKEEEEEEEEGQGGGVGLSCRGKGDHASSRELLSIPCCCYF